MYKWLYSHLRKSRSANFILHLIVESDLINHFPPYRFLYRRLINHRAAQWMMQPPFLEITVTDQCNASCIMCPPVVHGGKTIIDETLFRNIIEQAAGIGIKKLILTGGEPLLDPGIFDKISFAKSSKFIHVHMFTNGQLLNHDNALRLMRAGLDSLTLSIDSVDRAEYARIRKGLDFDTVMEHIRLFKRWRREAGFITPLFRLNRVNIPENRKSVQRFTKELDRFADVIELIDAHNFAEETNNAILDGALYGKTERLPCNLLFQKIVVSPHGEYRKCSIDYNQHAIIDSARTSTIEKVLGAQLAYLKKRMLRNDFSEPGCSECAYKQSWWIDWSQ